MDCSDLLTCGECHLVFSLSDIVLFIRHKQSACRAGVPEHEHGDQDVDDNDDDDHHHDAGRANGRAPAVIDGADADDKTQSAVCTNGNDWTNIELHQVKHSPRPGSASL